MTQLKALLGVTVLAVLAACAKPVPPPQPADDDTDEVSSAAPAPALAREATKPEDPAKLAASLLQLIDTAPQCEPFRARLEEAGRATPDAAPSMDAMNKVVSAAYDAGCGRKSGEQ
jgi:hypothetical protein